MDTYIAGVEELLIEVLQQDWMFPHKILHIISILLAIILPLYVFLLPVINIPAQDCYERIKGLLYELRNKTFNSNNRESLFLKLDGRHPDYHTFH